jgi:hypothetical protein
MVLLGCWDRFGYSELDHACYLLIGKACTLLTKADNNLYKISFKHENFILQR